MDEADRASDESEALLAEQIRLAGIKPPTVKPSGYCRYCLEPVAPDALYCDAECREDDESERAQMRRMGRR